MVAQANGTSKSAPPLNMLYFYLTGGCNLACQHCWLAPQFMARGGTGGHLDFELFKLAIAQSKPLGLSQVKLTGGEPLLHPDFFKMVDLLREEEIYFTLETNATLMDAAAVRYIAENSTVSHISVSLDGAESGTHDRFRGVPGSYEKTSRAIKMLAEAGIAPQVIMSLHEDNVHEATDLVRYVEGLGASSVKFNLIQPSGRGEAMVEREQVLDIHRLVEIGYWVEHDLQEHASIPLYYSWPIAFQRLEKLLSRKRHSCGILTILGVLSTGHLAMCGIGVHDPVLVYGQLGKDDLAEVWTDNPMLWKLRKQLPGKLEGVCSRCLMRDSCLGYCVAENYHVSQRLTAPYWFCQQAEAAGLFPESRLSEPVHAYEGVG